MLAKRIIPCLDVKDGRVVKGVNFVSLADAGDPAELARFYDKEGADELVFLDISASYEGRRTTLAAVERAAEQVFIPLTIGGGIRTVDDIRDLLMAGADKVSINTAAVLDPGFVSRGAARFGSQCIIVAVDAKRTGGGGAGGGMPAWRVFTHGGRNDSGLDVLEWAVTVEALGAGEILLTSMDRDGTTGGYDEELTRAVSEAVNIPVIASGGAGTLEHFRDVFLRGKADAALAASVFHYGRLSIRRVKEYLSGQGVVVRI